MTSSEGHAIAIVAAGVVSSVGASAASTCAAIGSALNDFRETGFFDGALQPVLGAAVPSPLISLSVQADASTTGGLQRLAAMFVRAAKECAGNAGGIDPAQTALLLIGPELARAGMTQEHLQTCFDALVGELGQDFHAASRITQIGTAGVAVALQYGQELLEDPARSGVDGLLIAAADSLLNADDINDALAKGYLLTQSNSDGFIPGEACACVFVRRLDAVATDTGPQAGAQPPRPAVLRVAGVGLASDADNLDANQPARGRGLAHAITLAAHQARIGPETISTRLSDGTAQSWFFEEATYAWARVLRVRSPDNYAFLLPAGQVGHVGVAMGPLLLALALDRARSGDALGSLSLVHLSSPGNARGAVVVQSC